MREYSDNVNLEFKELVARVNSHPQVRLILREADSKEISVLEGTAVKIDACTLTVLDAIIQKQGKARKEKLTSVPLGGFVQNYEILTPPHFNAQNERKAYYAGLEEKWKKNPVKAYVNAIFGE
ncbi:hypothetical protein JW756_03450 [Candidatus Woesearchaeota archaeon]|nr:hypothetical protein [Candidatus Woesearchaeota archaeon]